MIYKLALCAFIFFIGCASRSSQLAQEYDRLSNQIEKMQNELKATVNAQQTAEEYVRVKAEIGKRMEKLFQIRDENDAEGIPIGIALDSHADPNDLIVQLKENYEALSKEIDALKKQKGKIAEEQVKTNP